MKGIKSRDVAQLAWKANKDDIKAMWHDWEREYWEEFKSMCKSVIRSKYGKDILKQCSPTFLGYCVHYLFVQCIETWGRTNQGTRSCI